MKVSKYQQFQAKTVFKKYYHKIKLLLSVK